MDRIQRALDLARSQRGAAPHLTGQGVAPPQLASSSALQPVRPTVGGAESASLARVVSVERAVLRERRIIMPDDPDPAAHAYRMLRTQLLRQARTQQLRLIGVVSSADGEGKTLTAANLALSMAAEPNQTVLLVDLDLRHPSLAALLGLNVERGLDSWFNSEAAIAELFVKIEGIDRLRVLPTLHPVLGSSEALAGPRANELLTQLKSRYTDRLVIVDLPPALLADDVLTIAPLLDGVLLVVSEGRTRREDLTRLKELLGSVRVLGTVLNIASESEKRAY